MEQQQHQPILLPKLQTALTCLYNNRASEHHRHEAHQFLLTFKSSNLRRFVVSRLQSQKDKNNAAAPDNNSPLFGDELRNVGGAEESSTIVTNGSIYLSCLALLLLSNSHNHNNTNRRNDYSHEWIFAAQTLNHRCRSIRIVEAYDIEAEDGLECGVARLVLAWEELRRKQFVVGSNNNGAGGGSEQEESKIILNAWLKRYVPMLAHRCGGTEDDVSSTTSLCHGGQLLAVVLERHSASLSNGAGECERGEERIKGNLIMLTLAVALYSTAFAECEEEHNYNQQQHPRITWANAVLSELGSALSVTALRVRYRPTQSKHDTPSSEPGVPPLIDLLIHSIHLVADAAAAYFSQQHHDSVIQQLVEACHLHAIKRSIAACLTSLPETVLLPPSSDRGDDSHRIPSVDRACLRAASMELRSDSSSSHIDGTPGTGMERMLTELIQSEIGVTDASNFTERLDDASALRILECCEAWARFVSVPLHVIGVTVGQLAVRYFDANQSAGSIQYQKTQNAAFQYVTSIFEGASPSLTVEDILSATMGVAAGGVAGKKKQGNKSKKRQERRLQNASISINQDDLSNAGPGVSAEDELSQRKNAACVAAAYIFGVSVHGEDHARNTTLKLPSEPMLTHGICSTVSIAASSVLPRLLWLERNANENSIAQSEQWWLESFNVILTSLNRLCQSANRDIRGLSYEPLMVLHESLNITPVVRLRMEQIAVDAICECALALSISCSYPDDYFRDLSVDNDEELEFERNDVRDVVRSVSSLDSGNFGNGEHKSPSMLILEYLLNSIYSTFQEAASHCVLPPESVVHAFSALAKPLNKVAKKYTENPTMNEHSLIITTLQSYCSLYRLLNASFESLPTSKLLPVSRLSLMGLASLAPFFSSLVQIRSTMTDSGLRLTRILENTIKVALEHAILSSLNIPELAAQSTLKTTRYDIVGAMRGPGGEDHVGCIALMRLASESEGLALSIMSIYGESLLGDIANLYNELKLLEQKRPYGCDFGIGVCPISRRLVLKSLSYLCMIQMKSNDGDCGKRIIQELLQATVSEIGGQKDLPLISDKLFRLCESVYDLASLHPLIVVDVFNSSTSEVACVFESLIVGYSRICFTSDIDPWFEQWSRLRGATVCLLRTCCKYHVSTSVADAISALVDAEVEAATRQCNQSPSSGSNIFNDHVVGEEKLNAGAYLTIVQESLTRIASSSSSGTDITITELRACLAILSRLSSGISALLLHASSEAISHTDPRPTIAEAWFQTMASLTSAYKTNLADHFTITDGVDGLIGESLNLCIALIFIKDLGSKKLHPPAIQKGMSLDGPQTLAMTEFMADAIGLGPSILVSTTRSFATYFRLENIAQNEEVGGTIIAAGLLRAASGALPPWAVELTPIIFRSLFTALGGDCDAFVRILANSTKLEIFGNFLAGRYFEGVSFAHIEAFLSKTREACKKGEWNKLKSIIKTACGGKKKESGFNLKPQFTCWECERL